MATPASEAYMGSAGLDLLSGVFGFLAAQEASSIAVSRASLITAEATANAQRYSEQADAYRSQQEMMYLGSGVKVSGSVIDTLNTSARLAAENIASIKMQGAAEATDQTQQGLSEQIQGRNQLVSGFAQGFGAMSKALSSGMGFKTAEQAGESGGDFRGNV